jgi:hypothetical protein
LYTAIEKEDSVNTGEEIADKYWYLGGICTFYGIELVDIISNRDEYTGLELAKEISKLNEIIKTDIIYDKYPIAVSEIAGVSQLLKDLISNTQNLKKYITKLNNKELINLGWDYKVDINEGIEKIIKKI